MSLVLAQNLVLSEAETGENRPLIGWRNIVTTANIVADTTASGFPASNLANSATFLGWKANDTTAQYLTITPGSADDIDYVGVTTHNLASAGIAVSIEGDDGSGYVELVAPVIPATDGPLLFRFTAGSFVGLRIKLASGDAAASIATVYAGKLLVLQYKAWQGFTPPPLGRTASVTNGRSESGQFLGRIVTGRQVVSKVPLSLLDPDWYRANLDPFLESGRDDPFFFAWRPDDYPDEVGYCWLTNDPQPQAESPHSLYALTLEMAGVV
jgi:hypothetical protein